MFLAVKENAFQRETLLNSDVIRVIDSIRNFDN